MKIINGKELMSLKELAELYSVTYHTIIQWKSAGAFKNIRSCTIGKREFFLKEDVMADFRDLNFK